MLLRNKIAIVVVGVGLALTSAYVIGTSERVVARVVRGQLSRVLSAPASFEGASFSFLKGLTLRGLAVLDPADPLGPSLVSAQTAHVDYVLGLFGGSGPRLTGIEIEAPRVRLERSADGSFAIAKILRDTGGPRQPVPRIELRHAEVTFADPTLLAGDPLALRDVSITAVPAARGARSFAGAKVDVTAQSDLLGPVRLAAVVGENEESATVDLDVGSIALDPAAPRRFKGELADRIAALRSRGTVVVRIRGKVAPGIDLASALEADVDVRDASLAVALPESEPGEPAPRPVEITGLAAKLHFADRKVQAKEVSFRALGGVFEASGTLEGIGRQDATLALEAKARQLHLVPETREFLPSHARLVVAAWDLAGTLDVHATAAGPLSSPEVAVETTIAQGHIRFVGYEKNGVRHGFAYDADDVHGTVTFAKDRLHLDAAGRHGPASLTARGDIRLMGAHQHDVPDITVVALDAPLDDDVRRAFAEKAPENFDRWGPSGVAARVTVHVWSDPAVDGEHDVTDVTLELDGRAGFVPHVLPEPLKNVRGRVEITEPVVDGRRESFVRLTDLTGDADGYSVRVSGTVEGGGPTRREDLRIAAAVKEASSGFTRALLGSDMKELDGAKNVVRKLGAAGTLDVDAHLTRERDGTHHEDVVFQLHGTSVRGWGEDIPLAAANVRGLVRLLDTTLHFEDLTGTMVLGEFSPTFTGSGRLEHVDGTPQPMVHLEAAELPLGDSLRKALGTLAAKAARFWETVRPVGSARADAAVDLRPETDRTPFELHLAHIHGGLEPMGLEIDNDDGSFHYDGRQAVISGLSSAIGAAAIHFEEVVYDVASGRLDAFGQVRGARFPEDLEGPIAPDVIAAIREVAPNRTLHAPEFHVRYDPNPGGPAPTVEISGLLIFRPRTRREVADPGYAPDGAIDLDRLVFFLPEGRPVYFQGEGTARGFAFNAGLSVDRFAGPLEFAGAFADRTELSIDTRRARFRVEGYPFENASAQLRMTPRGPHVETKARFIGGDFEAVVGPGPVKGAYHGRMRLVGGELEQFLHLDTDPRKEVATGLVDARVEFTNPTGAKRDLRGAGQIEAHEGRLMDTPGVGDLFRALTLGFYTPSLTDGRMAFDLDGEWLEVRELEVSGRGINVAIVGGEGLIGLDGRLDLLVHLKLDLIPIVILKDLFRILQSPLPETVRVTGTLRNPRVNGRVVGLGQEPKPSGDVTPPSRDPW
jgi:hypothetical protein